MLDDCLGEKNYIRQECNSIYIMMGTNDIRHNEDGIRAAKKLVKTIKETRKQKPQTNIKILEIPPFGNHNRQKERNLFNLAINKEDPTTIATAREMKSIPLDNILEEDGYHITPQAGKIIANSINKEPTEKTNMEKRQPEEKPQRKETPKQDIRPTTSTQTVTKSVTTIPTEAVRYLVGKQGKTVKNWKMNMTSKSEDRKQPQPDCNHHRTKKGNEESHRRNTRHHQQIWIPNKKPTKKEKQKKPNNHASSSDKETAGIETSAHTFTTPHPPNPQHQDQATTYQPPDKVHPGHTIDQTTAEAEAHTGNTRKLPATLTRQGTP